MWHFRRGGLEQVRAWRERQATALPPTIDRIGARVPSPRARTFGDLRAAVILDEFSMRAWGGEFDVVAVTPMQWRAQLAEQPVDLVLAESAWNGNAGAWQYQLTGSKAPTAPLREFIAHCREQGIPTVFWNKEDPPHFDDFLETAKLFDVVFTSDSRLIPAYREALGHDRVEALAFAAAPALHNPIRESAEHAERDIAFAGMYFAHKYPERREQMDLLLGAAARLSKRRKIAFDIFSRFNQGDERYQFPGELADHVVGSLPYDRMLSAYGDYKVFLNVNSVVDSPSMCARRVFEITAAGTPVVTTPSAAIREFFPGDEVAVASDEDEAERVLRALVRSPQMRDRMVHRGQRRIWQHHTYSHRAATVLSAAGVPGAERVGATPNVTVMVSTNRPQQLDHILAMVARQQGVETQLALLTHGFAVEAAEFERRARAAGIDNVILLDGEANDSLGSCLNRLVRVAEGNILAKFDDDDLYGQHYLLDAVNALGYSGADLVGKQAVHLYLESLDATVVRNPHAEHRWTHFVAGPTLVGPRETFHTAPFADRTRGEDTTFLRALGQAGGKVYSADRFNFIQVRAAQTADAVHRHTWDVADEEILANADLVGYGRLDGHVMC